VKNVPVIPSQIKLMADVWHIGHYTYSYYTRKSRDAVIQKATTVILLSVYTYGINVKE